VFYGGMNATKGARLQAPSWFGPPDHVGTGARKRSAVRARRSGDSATSLRAIIASSAFLVLFSVSLMIGGHAAIDPLLRSAMAARETKDIGDVVFPLPDGKLCRHMSFDNATAEVVEGRIGPCPENLAKGAFRSYRGFAWGGGEAPSGPAQ
jgi:hypothetical protein